MRFIIEISLTSSYSFRLIRFGDANNNANFRTCIATIKGILLLLHWITKKSPIITDLEVLANRLQSACQYFDLFLAIW